MYRIFQQLLQAKIAAILLAKYDLVLAPFAIEQPPNVALGELALPVAFDLAKRLRKAPRAIAAELAEALTAGLAELPGIASVEVAGAGYLNVHLDRAATVLRQAADDHADIGGSGFRLVEHTSINPNKAAHIGHLRNAILGDTFQRLLRPDDYKSGYEVGVQNYIDNTGIQVADVVVGFTHLLQLDLTGVRQLLTELMETNRRIDYFCWDLYAQVSQWYAADPGEATGRKQIRLDTLHAIEAGSNEIATIADLIATSVLRRHLETMERLGIEYDFLPRESEILTLHFWDAARTMMIDRGVLYEETEGKNKGCWVMKRANTEEFAGTGPDEEAKVIVRSNGTVTYVGKDIAYHLWKFGLLEGKDFGYERFHEYRDRTCWVSAVHGEPGHPVFARADFIYNVIDSSQADPQNNVIAALQGMGFTEAAKRYQHFSYEKVTLTPRCAEELGYTVAEEDKTKPFVEVSGRKGLGVKADDLIDRLIAAARVQVDARNPEEEETARTKIATQIAVGALRYFMLRFNRNTMIAFDFKDALSFEGETGPYIQYAAVRASTILKRLNVSGEEALGSLAGATRLAAMLEGEDGSGVWEVWLAVSRLTAVLELCLATAEPAHLAKYVFQLAQQFNNFYHRFHILSETDAERRTLLLATASVARREMVRGLGYLGIEVPGSM